MNNSTDRDLPEVRLRPITGADEPFLIDLYSTVRADELRPVPWTDEQKRAFVESQFTAQQFHYRQKYPDACFDIIVLDSDSIGRLYVARLEDEIRIIDILLLPDHRNRGIGTRLLSPLVSESENQNKPLTIYVEELNPSIRLFERLGFKQKQKDGIHILMERPSSGSES